MRRLRPYLDRVTYVIDEWLERWPDGQAEARRADALLRTSDVMWRMEGAVHPILVGIWRSTERLTSGRVELRAGQRSDPPDTRATSPGTCSRGGSACGCPSWGFPGPGRLVPHERGDGFYVPAGAPYVLSNQTERVARFTFRGRPDLPRRGGAGESSDP